MVKNFICLILLASFSGNIFSQNLWNDVQEKNLPTKNTRQIIPQKYRTLRLDLANLKTVFAATPKQLPYQNEVILSKNNQTVFQIPMPDGSLADFRLTETPIMENDLQAKYPEIRTFTGVGITDPTAFLKCDLTMKGFHAMILSEKTGTIFIDPFAVGDTENYISYFKKDYSRKDAPQFICETESLATDPNLISEQRFQGDCQKRTYRLAMACTGEYANFHGATGTNKAPALAAIVTSMNRVNGVYEKELAITMVLVANTDLVIYTNSATDPFTNNSGGTMLGQNQTNMTTVIGSANYDMGHVFSTGGGGIANLSCICNNGNKARGVTGLGQPIGDGFDIDYVAHEMGHQFGGNHTYNNCDGDGNSTTGMEPGSGSTIMAYAGICGSNVQPHSDAYFQAINLQEIGNFVTTSTGNTCPVKTITGNTAPTNVDAGLNKTIPKSTPFALTAFAIDPDGNPLTFCWEQMDPAQAATPPVSTSTAGPLFRSLNPTSSPTRFFPPLANVINNTANTWEVLPSVGRTLKFRVTARDNAAVGGCTEEDDLTLTVSAAAGPFLVTAPNTAITWFVGDAKDVTWNVANTAAAPVNTANVKISLSTDGGLTYPIVLAEDVPNSGTAAVTVPNNLSTTCRVKVEAIDNYFYDISNTNFKIELPPTPTFVLGTNSNSVSVCAGATGNFDVNLTSILNFANPVNFTFSGLPAGATASANPNPATPTVNQTTNVSLSDFTSAMVGKYTLTVTGTSGATVQTTKISVTVLPGTPTVLASATAPIDGQAGVAPTVVLKWSEVNFAENYFVELATNPSFSAGSIILSANVDTNFVTPPLLNGSTIYYWRVQASNTCGLGGLSPISAFQTGFEVCNQTFASSDVPKMIDSAATTAFLVVSNLNVPANKVVTDVNLTFQIGHTYVGDLLAGLSNPSGDTIILFDQPGIPATAFGCSGNNISASLDDEAALTSTNFEDACATTNPAIAGTFQSLESLSIFDGKNAAGTWSLLVADLYGPEDGGQITSWSLNFCFSDPVLAGILSNNSPLSVPQGGLKNIPTANLQAQASAGTGQVTYILLSLPQHGTLTLNGNPLAVGDSFSQANIDANQVSYTHNGNAATTDSFVFDFEDENNSAWFHNGLFQINIVQNTLAASLASTTEISCHNGSNGQITATTTGGTAPFSFTLNNGAPQPSNVFSNLVAGSYAVVVSDVNGFTLTTNQVILNNPSAITASTTVSTDDLTINGSGGTGVLTYSIDNQSFTTNNFFENLPNGIYNAIVKDENGCTATATALVAVNSLVVNLAVQSPILCNGDANGALVVEVAGGQTPYQYSLNGDAFQGSNVFTDLAPGSYSVEVKDNFGLTMTTQTVVLEEPTVISVSASANLNTATVSATGGTGNLTFSLDGTNFQSGNTFGNLANGDYTITVRDANGCTATASATISVAALSGNVEITAAIPCFGGGANLSVSATGGIPTYQFKLDGNAYQTSGDFSNVAAGSHTIFVKDAAGTVFEINNFTISEPAAVAAAATVFSNDVTGTATGGTSPFTFELSNGDKSASGSFPNLPNGSYVLTATDANGCTGTSSFTMDYTALSANVKPISPNCATSNNGQITVTASGGTPAFEYSLDGVNFQTSPIFTNLAAGNYNITVRDAAGEIFTINNVAIIAPPAIVASATAVQSTVTVTASGGTGTLTFSLDGGTFQTGKIFQNVPGGSHTITVKDANGCTQTLTINVLANTLTAEIFPISTPCPPENLQVDLCANNGYPPYTFTITPNTASAIFTGNCNFNVRFGDVAPGNYTVQVTDSEGFVKTVTFQFNPGPAMQISASNTMDDIEVAVQNGTPPFLYSLNNGANQSSNIFPNLPNGNYFIAVTDANGCEVTTTFMLNYIGTVEPNSKWGLEISPNPSTGFFNILLKNGSTSLTNRLEFSVFDAAGRRLRSFEIEKSAVEISHPLDLSDLPAGTYLLRLTDGKDVGAVRLSIVK